MLRLTSLSTACVLLSLAADASAQCRVKVAPESLIGNSQFGADIDSANGRTFIGAWYDGVEGSVYVYEETARGEWTWTERLHPGDGMPPGDAFGLALDADGDTLLVGAPRRFQDKGGAYFYEFGPHGWTEQRVRMPEPSQEPATFGTSVAVRGDTAMIGAPDADGREVYSGAVYVYQRSGSTWSYVDKIEAADGHTSDKFGRSVAFDGSYAVVGAYLDDTVADEDAGSAYVFESEGSSWRQVARFVDPEGRSTRLYGITVDLLGDRAVVGAPGSGPMREGAVFVYERRGGTWQETARLAAPDPTLSAALGFGLALAPDRVVAGARRADGRESRSGAVYVFDHAGGQWAAPSKLVAEDGVQEDGFGAGVGVDGDFVWAGAIYDDERAFAGGSAYRLRLGEPTSPYCFGQGCPCDNDDPHAGCANESGRGAFLATCGSTSVATDDLMLTTTNLPLGSPTQLVMGDATRSAPFGDGLSCVTGGALGRFRYAVKDTVRSSQVTYGPGVVAISRGRFGASGHIVAGQTWHFQAWYRSAGPCGSGFNTSNAVAVTFRL